MPGTIYCFIVCNFWYVIIKKRTLDDQNKNSSHPLWNYIYISDLERNRETYAVFRKKSMLLPNTDEKCLDGRISERFMTIHVCANMQSNYAKNTQEIEMGKHMQYSGRKLNCCQTQRKYALMDEYLNVLWPIYVCILYLCMFQYAVHYAKNTLEIKLHGNINLQLLANTDKAFMDDLHFNLLWAIFVCFYLYIMCQYSVQLCEKFARNRIGETYAVFRKKSKLLPNTDEICIDGRISERCMTHLCMCQYAVQLCEKIARNRNGETYEIFIKKSKLLSNTEKIYIDGLYL